MKFTIVLSCVVLAVLAEPPAPQEQPVSAPGPSAQYGAPSAGYSAPSGRGRQHHSSPSSQYGAPFSGYGGGDEESQPANYEFKYDVQDQESGVKFGHQETRQGDEAQGEYYVLLPDGRTQHVQYTADQDGYHPKITYEGGEGYARGPSQGYPRGGPSTPGYSL